LRDDNKFAEFESGGDDFFTEYSDVVLVCVPHVLDKAMRSGSLEQAARDLSTAEFRQMAPKCFVLEATDVELAVA
jgi:hypothetical protein